MEDGRKSFRQISRETKVSAPTVELRFNRMKKNGIIKSIMPLFDIEKIEDIILGLVYLKVNPLEISSVIDNISSICEIRSIFTITGEYNIVFKIITKDINQINRILEDKIYIIKGVISVSFQILTKIIKDDLSFTIKEGQRLKAKCIYCYNDIKNHSRAIKLNNSENYFCCNSCCKLYKQKYGVLDTIPK